MTIIVENIDYKLLNIEEGYFEDSTPELSVAAYQTSQLAGIAAMNGDVVKLHPADIGFILESQEAPTRTPTPAMQRALKRFAKC